MSRPTSPRIVALDKRQVGLLRVAATERRATLGRTQEQVADLGGLSIDRIQAIESGAIESLRVSTLEHLDRGLDWRLGSALDVTLGKTPEPASKPAAAEGVRAVSQLPAWVYDLVADLLNQEELHPKLFFQHYSGEYMRLDWCPMTPLALVPDEVKAHAAVIAAYKAETQPPEVPA